MLPQSTHTYSDDSILGEVRFRFGRQFVTARLTESLRWLCDERVVEDYLNTMFEPEASNRRGSMVHFLYQVGERLGGDVTARREATHEAVA